MKITPVANKRKTVVLDEIDIFFSANVGILLTNKIATIIVKKGVTFFMFGTMFKLVSS